MICFYCCEHIEDEHVCQELAESRHEAGLPHDSDTVLYYKAELRQLAHRNDTKGS